MFGVRLDRDWGPVPSDLAVGVVVELFRDGKKMSGCPLCPLGSMYGAPTGWIRIDGQQAAWNEEDPAEMLRWTVRIRRDARTAMHDVERRRCWSGEYTMPLGEFITK
jgi:hypothetical protein